MIIQKIISKVLWVTQGMSKLLCYYFKVFSLIFQILLQTEPGMI